MKHTIAVLVENKFGVLAHVSGLFSSRGFNINSLSVGETEDPRYSRMTIVVTGDNKILAQIIKQLDKLIDVIKVVDLTGSDSIDREVALIKLKVTSSTRMEVMQVVQSFRAKIVDVGTDNMTVEVVGTDSKIDAMLELLRPYGLLEVVRTGVIALSRTNVLKADEPKRVSSKKKSTKKMSRKKTGK